MDIRALLLLVGSSFAGSSVFADACHVSQSTTTSQVPAVVMESCYEFTGMPADAINWSCSNESNQPLGSEKKKVVSCKSGSVAVCSAALTQESLANHRSTGDNEQAADLNVPEDAKVITRYYSLEDSQQAKIDCENGGGTWKKL
ncbi:MAG TPA: hypothetical protein VFF22_07870 [Pseudomonas sp.]|nr:hypothetical protein [Pseudomonas sp.]